MSDKELNELIETYERYKETGEIMNYLDFIRMFDELLKRYKK